ncbi:hypothetical protein LINGRAHAP2_LOCUS30905 [Linum grandiflorum]
MAARLWGYEGPIQISLLSEGFYLLEFPSYALSSWVLQWTWHIHHMPMILRRWKLGISPLALSPTARPTWVTLRDVPPPLLTREGISWLVSQLGEPTGKFVRDGLKVKICVFASPTNSPQEVLSVNLGPCSEHIIHVEYPAARSYGKDAAKPVRHWREKQPPVVVVQPDVPVVQSSPEVLEVDSIPAETMMAAVLVAPMVTPTIAPLSPAPNVVSDVGSDDEEVYEDSAGQVTPILDPNVKQGVGPSSSKPTLGDFLSHARRGRGRGRGRPRRKRR